MSDDSKFDNMTEERSTILEEASYSIIEARKNAAERLSQSGLEPVPDNGWFGSPCGQFCGCTDYTGIGGPCQTNLILPGGGAGGKCGHRPSQHLET